MDALEKLDRYEIDRDLVETHFLRLLKLVDRFPTMKITRQEAYEIAVERVKRDRER